MGSEDGVSPASRMSVTKLSINLQRTLRLGLAAATTSGVWEWVLEGKEGRSEEWKDQEVRRFGRERGQVRITERTEGQKV